MNTFPDKPLFLIIGAAKSATTSLCHQLDQHPEISIADEKEPDFFSVESKYRLGFDWYRRQFDASSGIRAWGDGSTSYSINGSYPETVSRVFDAVPSARLIYMVRHPLDRIRSHVQQHRHNRKVSPDLRMFDLIKSDPYYLDGSLYWKQLEAYRACFPDDRIHIEFFDDYATDPLAVIRRCLRFIGVDEDWAPDDPDSRRNATSGHTQEPSWVWRLKQIPGIRRLTPTSIKRLVQNRLGRPLRDDDVWTPESRAWAIERIEEDAARFLNHVGRAAGFWKF